MKSGTEVAQNPIHFQKEELQDALPSRIDRVNTAIEDVFVASDT